MPREVDIRDHTPLTEVRLHEVLIDLLRAHGREVGRSPTGTAAARNTREIAASTRLRTADRA